ncbi:hypothetical protein BH20ACT9_BH20ACT9_12460 [soil metagenome]
MPEGRHSRPRRLLRFGQGLVVCVLSLLLGLVVVGPLTSTPAAPRTTARVERIVRTEPASGHPRPEAPARGPAQQRPRPPVRDARRGGAPAIGARARRARRARRMFASASRRSVALGTIRIPAIDLRTPFFSGVHRRALRSGPGNWPGTAVPGTAGNAVLSGHRTTFTRPFRDLDRVRPGDRIATSVGRGPPVVYRVDNVVVVPEERYVDVVLRRPQRRRARVLTLFACHPKGLRTHRIVVRAHADDAPRDVRPRRPRTRPPTKEVTHRTARKTKRHSVQPPGGGRH